MRGETIARSYAEALVELAEKHGELEAFGEGLGVVARLLDENRDFREFLETPRVAARDKKRVLRRTFADALPHHLMNFLLVVVAKRRQRLLREISRAYHGLVDERLGRVRVEVTLARHQADEFNRRLTGELSELLGRTAVPDIRIRPEILGGVIVRAGDRVYDGSLRRRLTRMRRRLLQAGPGGLAN